MSRLLASNVDAAGRFPRVSGDEPDLADTNDTDIPFSPRERG